MEEKTKNNKKRKLIIVIIILLLLVTGISYAAFTYNFKGTESLINVKPVELELLESTGEIINIQNAFPMTDTDGIVQSETFDFAVTTRTEAVTDIFYSLKIEKVSVDSGYTSLQDSDVKIYLTDFNNKALIGPRKISNLTDNIFYRSYNSHTSEGTEVTTKFKLRTWIDEDVDAKNWDMNTKLQYKFKLGVDATEYDRDAEKLNPKGKIPEGAYYANFATGTFYNEMPNTVSVGDGYLYDGYAYTYGLSDGDTSGWQVILATEEMFENAGYADAFSNFPKPTKNQTTYPPILESINGVPITSVRYLFQNCTQLVESPVIPGGVTHMEYTFDGALSLAKTPIIPKTVTTTEGLFGEGGLLKSDTNIYSFNTDYVYSGSALESIGGHTTNYKSLNKSIFLKHNIGSVGRIETHEVCFIFNGEKYCLKGTADYYEENKSLLLELFGENNCSVYSTNVRCSLSGLYAYAADHGNVYAYDSDWHCDVHDDGNASCNER